MCRFLSLYQDLKTAAIGFIMTLAIGFQTAQPSWGNELRNLTLSIHMVPSIALLSFDPSSRLVKVNREAPLNKRSAD